MAYGILMDGPTRRDLTLFNVSVSVGMLFAVVTGFPFGAPIFTAFLKQGLGMSDSLYGIVSAIPWLTVLVQLPVSRWLKRHPLIKEVFLWSGLLFRTPFIVLGVLAAAFLDSHRSFLIGMVFLIMTFSSIMSRIAELMFNIWMGAAVPRVVTGRFLSGRQQLLTLAQLVYALAATIGSNAMGDWPYKFSLLLILAGIAGCIDYIFFFFMRRPQDQVNPLPEPTADELAESHALPRERTRLRDYAVPYRDPRYRSFLIYGILSSLGNQLYAPYSSIYLLEDMNMPMGTVTFYQVIIPAIATILTVRLTGRLSDRFGYRNIILLFGTLAALNPSLWALVTPRSEWVALLLNTTWGISHITTEVAIFSMAIFLAPDADRSLYISVKGVSMYLLGSFPGTLMGGFLSDALDGPLASARLPWIGGMHLRPFHVLVFAATAIRLAGIYFALKLPQDNVPYHEFLTQLRSALLRPFRRRPAPEQIAEQVDRQVWVDTEAELPRGVVQDAAEIARAARPEETEEAEKAEEAEDRHD